MRVVCPSVRSPSPRARATTLRLSLPRRTARDILPSSPSRAPAGGPGHSLSLIAGRPPSSAEGGRSSTWISANHRRTDALVPPRARPTGTIPALRAPFVHETCVQWWWWWCTREKPRVDCRIRTEHRTQHSSALRTHARKHAHQRWQQRRRTGSDVTFMPSRSRSPRRRTSRPKVQDGSLSRMQCVRT